MKKPVTPLSVLSLSSFVKSTIMVVTFLLFLFPCAFGRPRLTIYYPTWCQMAQDEQGYGVPPWNINWTGIDYVVHFMNGNTSASSPYFVPNANEIRFGPGGGNIAYGDSLIAVCHRNGVKVLLTIQAVDPGGLNAVSADSLKCVVFGTTASLFACQRGYDGLELDWEGSITSAANVNRFTRILRRCMNTTWPTRPLLFTSAGRFDQNLYWASQDTAIDMHNLQMYSYGLTWNSQQGRNQSYFQTPVGIQPGAPAGLQSQSLDHDFTTGRTFPQLWQDAGHSLSKIGLGFGSYGQLFTGITSWGQNYSGYQNDVGLQEIESMTSHGGTYTYYSLAQSPAIAGTATGNSSLVSNGTQFYITYDSDSSIAAKVQWAVSQGVGGVMLYDVKGDMHANRSTGNRLPTIYKAARMLVSTDVNNGESGAPTGFRLTQNYPNPFNPTTNISYALPRDGHVTLTIFNILGQELVTLVDEEQRAGNRSIEWNAGNVSSGTYFCRLQEGDLVQTRKMVVLR